MEDSEDVNPSELGKKEYWDDVYSKELINFEDHDDEGENWFGARNSMKVLDWIVSKSFKKTDEIIDLGCGNGHMLMKLSKKGYTGLTGVDYSSGAIELASRIFQKNQIKDIKIQTMDILDSNICEQFNLRFKLVHDKGTYDAISMLSTNSEIYNENVTRILSDDGYLIITSCNWTKKELIDRFKNYLNLVEELPVEERFEFGGRVGQTVTQLIFQKMKNNDKINTIR